MLNHIRPAIVMIALFTGVLGVAYPFAVTGVAQTVNLYGRAVGKAGLPAGTYTDTVAVELTF